MSKDFRPVSRTSFLGQRLASVPLDSEQRTPVGIDPQCSQYRLFRLRVPAISLQHVDVNANRLSITVSFHAFPDKVQSFEQTVNHRHIALAILSNLMKGRIEDAGKRDRARNDADFPSSSDIHLTKTSGGVFRMDPPLSTEDITGTGTSCPQ